MAKKRKKKTQATTRTTLKSSISKSQFDRGCAIARKMIQFLGFEASLFDLFSKKQKLNLLRNEYAVPNIKVKKGHFVPRHYVRNVRSETLNFMRDNYLHEPSKLTYMEFVTYGLPFILILRIRFRENFFLEEQNKFIEPLLESADKTDLLNKGAFDVVFNQVAFQLSQYSQVNFRTYGFTYTYESVPNVITGFGNIRFTIELTAHECKPVYFVHQNKRRIAHHFILAEEGEYEASTAVLKMQKIYPGSKSEKKFNIHIQPHTIHRFKERIDVFEPTDRNLILNLAMTRNQKVVHCDKQLLLACNTDYNISLGYFPFITQGDDLFILTFIPFVNEITPEGKILHDILKLSKDDLVYLGMDKLSFYIHVDFEQIPVLKDALIKSGIWKIKELLDTFKDDDEEIDEKKTLFVKEFFEKTSSQVDKMTILDEIADKYDKDNKDETENALVDK